MTAAQPLVDFAPTLRLLAIAALIACLPLAWWWLRRRDADRRGRLASLTALTMFLTLDLVVFGSFTRLTDSGLGCPDWPGCYGEASPFGARGEIQAAQTAMPTGPVTHTKAWIEMIHRYLAMTVGALILVMTAAAWRERFAARSTHPPPGEALPFSPWWPAATLAWVVVQGLFGKYTVTLKLYPAIVTLHLLGGLVLLMLLVMQHEAFRQRPLALSPPLARGAVLAGALLALQIALGGWVSTNYAVLACNEFPRCAAGEWWPPMDWGHAFTFLRHLGQTGSGDLLPLPALVAIHMAHRLCAVVAALALVILAWRLWREPEAAARRFGLALALLTAAQVASGLSNVVLGWPIVAALAHSAGAALLTGVLTALAARSWIAARARRPSFAGRAPSSDDTRSPRAGRGAA